MSEQTPLLLRWNLESFVAGFVQGNGDSLATFHMQDFDVAADVAADESLSGLGYSKLFMHNEPSSQMLKR